jgi:HSP20 family protein
MAWELMNSHPFEGMEKVRSEMDRLIDTFLFGVPYKIDFTEQEELLPAVDVTEMKNEIVVSVEVPGMDSKDFDISLSEGTLTITGEKKQDRLGKEELYHLIERRCGTFSRSIPLPQEVESDKISASYKNGILTVILPKSERTKKEEIKIKIE